jgi:hypothetical protein
MSSLLLTINKNDSQTMSSLLLTINKNDSQTMSSLLLTINKNDAKDLHLLIFLIQNAFTGNSAIDIYEDRDALVWQQWSEKWSVEYTIKLPYKVIQLFPIFICLIKTICRKYMIIFFNIWPFQYHPGYHLSTSCWYRGLGMMHGLIWKSSFINVYIKNIHLT